MSAPIGVTAFAACPSCGEVRAPADRFCESCGASLIASLIQPPTVSQPVAAAAGRACPCGNGIADADGYCESCGRLVPAETDHGETDLGAAGAVVTDRGVRHSRNEDAACLLLSASTAVVVAVADGVSTSDDPQKASAAAARAAAETLAAAEPSNASLEIDDAVLLAAVRRASAAVGAVTDPALLGPDGLPRAGTSVPACTLVAAHVRHAADGARVAVVSVGDSRAYWIPESGVGEQLSVEDSWAAEEIAAGAEPDAVYADPRAHQITAWIGLDAGRLSPHVSRRRLDRPGTLLLCSDGLWNYLPDVADMTSLVRQHLSDVGGSPLAAARSLTDFARGRGGHDNITVALIPTPTDPALTMTTGVAP